MLHEMIRASDLVTEIEAFERQQAGRVESIERAIRDAEAMIDDIQEGKQRVLVEALQQGRMIPAGNLDWERSTVSGETSSDDSDLGGGMITIFASRCSSS
jgi:hypothetical protein